MCLSNTIMLLLSRKKSVAGARVAPWRPFTRKYRAMRVVFILGWQSFRQVKPHVFLPPLTGGKKPQRKRYKEVFSPVLVWVHPLVFSLYVQQELWAAVPPVLTLNVGWFFILRDDRREFFYFDFFFTASFTHLVQLHVGLFFILFLL